MNDPAGAGGGPRVRRGPVAWLWFAAGWVAVGIGTLGVIVPGLPTTVFFLVAAWCFARCSPRFEQWVLDLPKVGPMVRDSRAGLGMPRRAKVVAIAMIVLFAGGSGLFLIPNPVVGAVVVGLGLVGVLYIGLKVPTKETVLARRSGASGL